MHGTTVQSGTLKQVATRSLTQAPRKAAGLKRRCSASLNTSNLHVRRWYKSCIAQRRSSVRTLSRSSQLSSSSPAAVAMLLSSPKNLETLRIWTSVRTDGSLGRIKSRINASSRRCDTLFSCFFFFSIVVVVVVACVVVCVVCVVSVVSVVCFIWPRSGDGGGDGGGGRCIISSLIVFFFIFVIK
jgi:hypothetical protein